MRLRPWHVIVGILTVSAALLGVGLVLDGRSHEVAVGLGLNLLSSVAFFVLLEVYWEQTKRANGKEVSGFDYQTFARNVGRSKKVRVLATFIYPLTRHPKFAAERVAFLNSLREAALRPSFEGAQLLFLRPDSVGAKSRAAERANEDVPKRMAELIATLAEFLDALPAEARSQVAVRLYDRMPSFALFQTDDFASMSFYYRDRPISEAARYEFFTDTPLGVFVERTFDDLWHDERTIPLAEYAAPRSGADAPA